MLTILEQKINKKRSNFLRSDLNKNLEDNTQLNEYPKRIWFKGSRYR